MPPPHATVQPIQMNCNNFSAPKISPLFILEEEKSRFGEQKIDVNHRLRQISHVRETGRAGNNIAHTAQNDISTGAAGVHLPLRRQLSRGNFLFFKKNNKNNFEFLKNFHEFLKFTNLIFLKLILIFLR